MYKVFINEKTIFLGDSMNLISEKTNTKIAKYESEKTIEKALNLLKVQEEIKCFLIYHDNLDELWERFKSFFKVIEAGGGLVKNPKDEVLFIFRLGKWDLPKGKMEEGESIENVALREVEEECGIAGLEIVRPLANTYHIYEHKGEAILKKTLWFEMFCASQCALTPQKEEGITEAKWLDKDQAQVALRNTYPAIQELLNYKAD